jgi:hypothetical protein
MVSACLSRGMSNPAACLAVRDLSDIGDCLGPGGDIGGGIAVPVHDQPTNTAMIGPRPQRHLLRDSATCGAGLGGGEPALAYHQLAPVPGRLVPKLSAEFGPGGIGDGSGKALVADKVGYRKVFDGQRAVGLGELARDLVEEVSADVDDVIVLSGQ